MCAHALNGFSTGAGSTTGYGRTLGLGIGQRALSSLSRLETPGYPVFRFVRMACVSVNIEDVSYNLITNKSR